MSDNSLPDEIVSEILSPALKVPDEKFADTSEISPFTEYTESPSAYLLVCKSWLRVATPLLYNVVVLRSRAQAKALAQALSKDKDLGQFIKHLRVEGGYGAPMRTILKAAPNVTDLCLSFELFASDNVGGLCDGLALIQPRRLIVRDTPMRPLHNKMVAQLEVAIAAAIPQWRQLTILHCPHMSYIMRRPSIVQALANARRLRELTVQLLDDAFDGYTLFQDCPFHIIQVTEPVYASDLEELRWENQPASFKDITKYEMYGDAAPSSASSHVLPTPQFSSTPMASESPEVQDKIWSRILYFLLSIPLSPGFLDEEFLCPPRLPFLLVSKTFYRLGLPHYYTHVLLFWGSASKFANVLESTPSLWKHVRTISAGDDFSDCYDEDVGWLSDHMRSILCRTTALTKLSGCVDRPLDWTEQSGPLPCPTDGAISWDAFETVASCRKLHELSIPIGQPEGFDPGDPDIFVAQLDELRCLTWTCSTRFPRDAPVNGLSKLTDLRIAHADASFLYLLADMRLQALRKLASSQFGPGFWSLLRSHGRKLVELNLAEFSARDLKVPILEVCPNIRVLYLYSSSEFLGPGGMLEVEHLLTRSTTADYLEKIVFTMEDFDKTQDYKWISFFSALESTQFPRLSEIQFIGCQWPKKERDIAKSKWVRSSGILLERGIHLTDKDGKKWRTRLK